MSFEKYTHGQLKELALKYNHIVGIKNVNKLSRKELEHELGKHLEVHSDAQGKHTVTIKSKSEVWKPRTDVGEMEAKKVYEKVRSEVIGEKREDKGEEKKKRGGRTAKDTEHKGYVKPVKKTRGRPKKEKV